MKNPIYDFIKKFYKKETDKKETDKKEISSVNLSAIDYKRELDLIDISQMNTSEIPENRDETKSQSKISEVEVPKTKVTQSCCESILENNNCKII